MKRYFIFSLFAALSVWACSPYTDLEPGGTAVQDLCGTWTVTRGVSVAEANGTTKSSFTYSSGSVIITSGSTDYKLQFNKNDVRFRYYNTSQEPVTLYKLS